MDEREIIDFEYIFLKFDSFSASADSRKRNDIIKIYLSDGSIIARMYINNTEEYVDMPYDEVMLNEISHITWTKDSRNGHFIKSDADKANLNEVIKRHDKTYEYHVYPLQYDEIDAEEKETKRKEFLLHKPRANSDNPWE